MLVQPTYTPNSEVMLVQPTYTVNFRSNVGSTYIHSKVRKKQDQPEIRQTRTGHRKPRKPRKPHKSTLAIDKNTEPI